MASWSVSPSLAVVIFYKRDYKPDLLGTAPPLPLSDGHSVPGARQGLVKLRSVFLCVEMEMHGTPLGEKEKEESNESGTFSSAIQ